MKIFSSPKYGPQTVLDTYKRFLKDSNDSRFDWINPTCITLIAITGLFFIYSAQTSVGGSFWKKQLVYLILGAGTYITLAKIDYKNWLTQTHWIYIGTLLLFFLLFCTPLGIVREGARRWLNFGIISLQPSEAGKIGALIMTASLLARYEVNTFGQSLIALFKVAIMAGIPIFLIFLQPDLGSALVIPPMVFSLLYISRLSDRFFIVVFGCMFAGIGLVGLDLYQYYNFYKTNDLHFLNDRGAFEEHRIIPLQDYQRQRLMTFIAPEAIDPRGTGDSWNYRQSLQAVGTGGLTGKGWTDGDQAQLGYLPRSVAHNDFIFAVLAEEKGFVGGVFVTGMYLVLLINTLRIASVARDRFGTLLAVGVSVMFTMHIFVNVGMTIGLMPITGLPLPFMSYGGSFVLSCCILQGLVQSVYCHRREFA